MNIESTTKIPSSDRKENKKSLVFVFLRGSLKWFILSALCALLTSVTELLSPQIVRFTVDSVIGDKEPALPDAIMRIINSAGGIEAIRTALWVIPLCVLAVSVFDVVFKYGFRICNTLGAETLVQRMRNTLFSHIEKLPFAWHMKNQTGDIIQRCTSDVDTVKRFLSEQLTQMFRIIAMLGMSAFFMLSMNVTLTLVAVASIPVILACSIVFHRAMSKSFRECDENEGKLSAIAQENLTGVRVVRAFGREKYERDRFEVQNVKYASLWTRLSAAFSAFWGGSDLISGIQIMLILVFGAVFVLNGSLTSGEYIAFISYNAMLIWPVRMLGRMIANLSKASVALDRIGYIMHSAEEQDKPDASEPPMNRDIRFENVSFGYDGCPELLSDINIDIKAGTTLGILGGTGSGKSTLVHLLCRLYDIAPEHGRITVGGVDIADIKAQWLRKNIGMVLQEPYLFSRSIAENIGIACRSITEEEIREAARTACFEETADSFTEGFSTFVGERGVTLSGGQKQRAAIARMLTQKSPVMIFDDSMSALDTETDAKIRHALKTQLAGSTVIIISHRITTLMHADNIVVLDHGKVSEQGTHEQLAASGGLYARIYELQSRTGEDAEPAGADDLPQQKLHINNTTV